MWTRDTFAVTPCPAASVTVIWLLVVLVVEAVKMNVVGTVNRHVGIDIA